MILDPGPFIQLEQMIMEMRMLGQGFAVLKVAGLVSMIEATGLSSIFDPTLVRQVFTDKSITTWYTIEAQGRVGNASRHIRAVFQAVTGKFYYVRIT